MQDLASKEASVSEHHAAIPALKDRDSAAGGLVKSAHPLPYSARSVTSSSAKVDTPRKRRGPPKLRPGGSSAAFALEYPGPVNLSEDPRNRPLVGRDIAEWREASSLERLQVVQMLAMATPHTYNRLTKGEAELDPLPFDLEMLLRFYLRQPIQVSQRRPADIFEKIYGPRLREFEETPGYESARVMLYSRFGAMLGRTVFSVYRWFKTNASGDYGGASGSLRRLLNQLPNDPVEMRQTLEGLARVTFKARGYDFEKMFPMPSPEDPPAAPRSGPKPRGTARAPNPVTPVEALAAQVESGA